VTYEVLVEVVRSGFVEGAHHGTALAVDADAATVAAAGEPDALFFARSSNKPLQLLAMLRHGLDLPPQLLALAAVSHSGEAFHLAGVAQILATAGLQVGDLANTADLPLDGVEADAWRRSGRPAESLAQNCSGKHAAMLATCRTAGWPTSGYLAQDHPLQLAIADVVAELTGVPVTVTGTDGCGAPVYATTARGLARAFAALATADEGAFEHRVAQAYVTFPEWVGGTGRDVTTLMRALPGLVAKDGAEAVWAVGLPDGGAAVVKIADGAERARGPVLAALLTRLGVPAEALTSLAAPPILGGGRPVGEYRVVGL
jgi:L-asparaginase II